MRRRCFTCQQVWVSTERPCPRCWSQLHMRHIHEEHDGTEYMHQHPFKKLKHEHDRSRR